MFIKDWNLWVRDVATGPGDGAHERRREGLRLRHRQRRLERAASAPSCCGRPTRRRSPPTSRTSARSATCTSSRRRPGHPVLAVVEVPAARRRARGDAAPRHHRRRHRARSSASRCRPTTTAPRSATTSACDDMTVEPRRRRSWRSCRRRATTSQAVAPRGRRGHRRRAHGVRRDRDDALRVARRLARAVGDERGHLVRRSATTGATSISTTSTTGALKNRITTGDGPRHADRRRLDEKTRTVWFTAMGREKGQDPYFRHALPDRPRRQGPRVAHARRRRSRRCSCRRPARYHRRHVLDVREAAGGRAARRRRQADDAAREGRHLEAAGRRAGSRRCRSA
ncbi:MAG: hypothetical protein MZV63_23750 [Marinilabiliales bacterium]|nr:hypothetical protein [Marinilabiliales bacterium]